MTDALSLDLDTVAAQCADVAPMPRVSGPRRSPSHWGASDIPTLLLAYDPQPGEWDSARGYHRSEAAHCDFGIPKIVARKAGLLKPSKPTKTMDAGTNNERTLIERWLKGTDVSLLPFHKKALPFVVHECEHASATPDEMGLDAFGSIVTIEAKCTRESGDAGWRWYWNAQVQTQIMACADYGILIVGPGWAMPTRSLFDGHVEHVVMPDKRMQERIKRVCPRAWEDVLKAMERKAS